MILRKIVGTFTTCGIIFIITALTGEMAFGLFMQMYLLPVLLFYGIPVSMFSDYLLRRLGGFFRGFIALFFHLLFAVIFILFPTTIGWKWDLLYVDNIMEVFNSIFIYIAIISAFIFWFMDEILKYKPLKDMCASLLRKIGELRL